MLLYTHATLSRLLINKGVFIIKHNHAKVFAAILALTVNTRPYSQDIFMFAIFYYLSMAKFVDRNVIVNKKLFLLNDCIFIINDFDGM